MRPLVPLRRNKYYLVASCHISAQRDIWLKTKYQQTKTKLGKHHLAKLVGVPQHLAALLLCNLENSLRPFEVARLNVLILLLWNSLLGLDFQVWHLSNFSNLNFSIICTSQEPSINNFTFILKNRRH